MNLIEDAWLPALRADGPDKIAPWQIVELENPVLELAAPRPDFQGALYQFLIGLLQTCFAPRDHDGWLVYWDELPAAEVLKEKFNEVALAFELDNPGGPAFMQDFNDFEGEKLPVEDLIGGALSDSTRSKNRDLFSKSGVISTVSPYWAAIALFNLQTSGVLAWGQHRVGLRGNGPITSLVLPTKQKATLWEKLWLNVLSVEDFDFVPGEKKLSEFKYIFPWLSATRLSPNKKPTSPSDGNPLQHYWAMPRRIRLFVEDTDGKCDISGEPITKVVREYKRIKNGVYYTEGWMHPLSPHLRKDRLSFASPVVGTKVTNDYRDWSALTLSGCLGGDLCQCSKAVGVFIDEKSRDVDDLGRIWCFGYIATNADVKGWYEASYPGLVKKETALNMKLWAKELVDAATDAANTLRGQLKEAWFKRTKDVKGDMSAVVTEFWQQSEPEFYALLNTLSKLPADQRRAPPGIYADWAKTIRRLVFDLFDSWALESTAEDLDMKRIVKARQGLIKKITTSKSMKTLVAKSKPEEEGKDGE